MSNKYDFDELDAYVPFTFQGNEYRFYYPTLEQTLEAEKLKEDESKAVDFMFGLVRKPEGAEYPDFTEVKNQMTLAQMLKFKEMLSVELGLEA